MERQEPSPIATVFASNPRMHPHRSLPLCRWSTVISFTITSRRRQSLRHRDRSPSQDRPVEGLGRNREQIPPTTTDAIWGKRMSALQRPVLQGRFYWSPTTRP